MLSVDDAARIMAAVQLGQQLPIDGPEAVAMAEKFRREMETFPPGVEVEVPGEWEIDDSESLISESLRFVLAESLVRSDRYRIVESSAGQAIMPGGDDHWKTQPRDKTGKWVNSGVNYDKWPQQNSAAMSAKKKIKLMEQMVASGDYAAFAAAAPIIHSKQPNSYQKGILQAYANLHEIAKKAQQAPPKGAVEVPGTPALAGWTKVGGSLGTEKGGTYIGPDGKKYYVKIPDNAARAHNEVLAFKLYELAGSHVVHSNLVQVEGKTGIATVWEDAEKLKWSAGDKVAASEDFATHAWLNNWDAVGAGSENPMDNIKLINGNTTLVDAGGSLDYSGMGGSGKKAFGYEANEWSTLRDPKINKTMAQVFGGMTDHQLYHSAMKLHQVTYNDISELVYKFHPGSNDDKNVMVDILVARKNAIIQKANALLMKNPTISIPDSEVAPNDEAPVVIMASPGTGTPEVIPKPPPAVVSATKTKVLPPPPVVMSAANPTAQTKLNALYEAASTGGIDALNAVKTNPDSKNTYAKKAHAYKMQLLNSLGDGAVSSPDHIVIQPASVAPSFAESKAAQAKAESAAAVAAEATETDNGKVSPKLFSTPPAFSGSKTAINQKHAADMIAFARTGDKAGIQAIDVPDGTKIGEYKKTLLAEMDQIPKKKEAFKKQKADAEKAAAEAKAVSEKAASEFKAKYGSFNAAAAEIAKGTDSKKKVGYWSVTHENLPVPKPSGVWNNQIDHQPNFELHQKGLELFKSLSANQKSALQYYTGGHYDTFNQDLVAGKGKATKGTMANHLAEAMKNSIPIPEGIMVSRKYTPGDGIESHDLQPGMVVKTGAVSSTSTDKNFWSGSVQMQIMIGPGVKGIPAAGFSTSEHYSTKQKIAAGEKPKYAKENEIILPPNQAYAIHSVEVINGEKIVYCIALPTAF